MRRFTPHPLPVVLFVLVAALLIAACGDDDDDSSDSSASAGGSAGELVSVESIDGTDVLVDADGRALYTAVQEADGRIRCVDSCTSDWDPVLGSSEDAASADVDAELAVTERPDGGQQLTLDGAPLYAFTREGPGQLTGDGLVDDFEGTEFEWQAATVSGGAAAPSSEANGDEPLGGYGY
jgi:predicted lipoprotein with Yx(FWY)xxD motif